MARSALFAKLALLSAFVLPLPALAVDVSLFDPAWPPFPGFATVDLGQGSREVQFLANTTFSISQIYAHLAPLGDVRLVTVEIRASSPTVPYGAVLHTVTMGVCCSTVLRYSFNAPFTFNAGSYYLIAVRSAATNGVHAQVATADERGSQLPFTPSGAPLTVIDGLQGGHAPNLILPLVGLNIVCPDSDSDGHAASTCGGTDCDDAAPSIYPGATELCDGLDNNCDSVVPANELDDDGDLQAACAGDCDDNDPNNFTGNQESCDGADNDCDTLFDDGVPTTTYYADVDGDSYGATATSTEACAAPSGFVTDGTDCDDGDALVSPSAPELCDGADSNCDGLVDNGAPDADADGVCDALDACDGDDSTGDADNDGICNDIDPSNPDNIPFLPWWALALLGGGLGRAGMRMSGQREA
jgi:hypothetical protein